MAPLTRRFVLAVSWISRPGPVISVDVASMQLVRTELRVATDAAAKAGAESLLRTQDQTKAVKAAVDMALLNSVGGKAFKIASNDVVVGTSTVQTDGSWSFSAGGPITLAFGKVFKAGSFTPSKTSTASAMTQEIALVLDRSGSMAWDMSGTDWEFPPGGEYDRRPKKGSRWIALEDAVEIYLREVTETPVPSRVALITWASNKLYDDLPDEDTSGTAAAVLANHLNSVSARFTMSMENPAKLVRPLGAVRGC